MKNIIFVLFILSLITVRVSNASQLDLDNEIKYYSDIFSEDDFQNFKEQYDKLSYSGISSPIVFDQIAEKLKANKNAKEKKLVESTAWLIKILSTSGNEKYRGLLVDIRKNADSGKLKRYARNYLSRLDKYVEWNAIISKGLVDAPDGQLEEFRTVNVMYVYDKEFYSPLVKQIKEVYNEKTFKTEVVAAIVRRTEIEVAREAKLDTKQHETLAWLVKTIGQTKDERHKPFLKKVYYESKIGKVRRYTRGAIKKLSLNN